MWAVCLQTNQLYALVNAKISFSRCQQWILIYVHSRGYKHQQNKKHKLKYNDDEPGETGVNKHLKK